MNGHLCLVKIKVQIFIIISYGSVIAWSLCWPGTATEVTKENKMKSLSNCPSHGTIHKSLKAYGSVFSYCL